MAFGVLDELHMKLYQEMSVDLLHTIHFLEVIDYRHGLYVKS